jgi:hypothetical protein
MSDPQCRHHPFAASENFNRRRDIPGTGTVGTLSVTDSSGTAVGAIGTYGSFSAEWDGYVNSSNFVYQFLDGYIDEGKYMYLTDSENGMTGGNPCWLVASGLLTKQ